MATERIRLHVPEHTVIFASVLKWVVLSSAVGGLVGLSCGFFLRALRWGIDYLSEYPYYFLLLPVALFLSRLITDRLAPEAEGHGTEKVIEAVHKAAGKIDVLVVPVKAVTTLLTLAAGGSVGKEGPCAQIGAGMASMFARLLRFEDADRRKIVICGISAGFAAVFGTPIAGAIFGVEVLYVGTILYDVLLPSFIAGLIGYQVSASLGVHYFYLPIEFVPAFSESFFIEVIGAGIFFGLCATLFIETLEFGQYLERRLEIRRLWKPFVGGGLLVLLTLLFSTDYLDLGLDVITRTLQGSPSEWYAFVLKTIFTSLTLGFGGSGGVVTPIFFVGATGGSAYASLINADTATFAAIGLVSLLAGCTNAPIAASVMSVELFGPSIAPFAALACVISFLMTGHRSVYPSQILAIRKSPSLVVEIGKEVEDIRAEFVPRPHTLVSITIAATRQLRKQLRHFRIRKKGLPAAEEVVEEATKGLDSTAKKS